MKYQEMVSELHTYRKIGTLDELLDAREKQNAKIPNYEGDGYDEDGDLVYDTWICPNCGQHYEIDVETYDYCPKCGQHINHKAFGINL